MKYDPQKHHRRSMRLKDYDYAQPGAYFVTLCAWQREDLFGEVVGGEVRLNPLGKVVKAEWLRSIDIRREICLHKDEFVIMPNHLHGIVWIVEIVGADGVRPGGTSLNVGDDGQRLGVTERGLPERGEMDRGEMDRGITDRGASLAPQHAPLRRAPRSLSSFVAGFKASVTSRARLELDITGIWQRNYYDHIIRNEAELKNIWHYIDTNPEKWKEDQMHPDAQPNPFNEDKEHG